MPDITVAATGAVGWVLTSLDFYAGVLCLVTISLTVMGGVLATDRTVLRPRHRVRAQLWHRAVGLSAVGFLVVHVTLRVVEGHIRPLDLAVPFLADQRIVAVGLGTVAAQLMILLAVTGVARGRFAYGSRPVVWRAIHATAYLCWPVALAHGLQAGRSPRPWVILGYAACIALVLLALLVRVFATWRRRVRVRKNGLGKRDTRKLAGAGPTPAVTPGPATDDRPRHQPLPVDRSMADRSMADTSMVGRSAVDTSSVGTRTALPAPAWEALATRGAVHRPAETRARAPLGLPDDRPVITSDEDFWEFLRSPEPDGSGSARRR
jgi:DMSO/TMAO reductase YedYZ heme-binding membrane subunit